MAPAWVSMARALRSDPGSLERQRAAVARALQLDPNLAEGHLERGRYALFVDWDFATAEAAYRQAVLLDPGSPDTHHSLSMVLAMAGRYDEAIAHIDVARSLDPLSLAVLGDGGMVYFLARRFDRTIDVAELALQIDPDRYSAHQLLFDTYLQTGDDELALEQAGYLLTARGADQSSFDRLAAGSLDDRLRAYHEWNLASLRAASASSIALADAHLRLGNVDAAFASLEEAYQQRSSQLLFVIADPRADPYRDDPRFVGLARRLGLV